MSVITLTPGSSMFAKNRKTIGSTTRKANAAPM
jgi:hypothetical protein